MKKLKKLSLSSLSQVELDERKMSLILGGEAGYGCQCGCKYEGEPGGSSTASNDSANTADGLNSGACPSDPPQTFCDGWCESPNHPRNCEIVVDQVCGRQNLFC